MRYLVERPLPGEIWSSTLLRTSRHVGLSIHPLMLALTGRKWAPSFFQMAHLVELAPLVGLEPRGVLDEHTVFGYCAGFMSEDVRSTALRAALSTGISARGIGSVIQSVSDHVRLRRYCRRCAQEDLLAWGESYWHVEHNLPGVLVCYRHERTLRETELRTCGPGTWSKALPHEVPGRRILSRAPTRFQLELAKRSVELLHRREDVAERPTGWYRDGLISAGLVCPSRAVSEEALVPWLRSFLGRNVALYDLCERDRQLRWSSLMVRPSGQPPFIPLKHLLFETAIALYERASTPVLNHSPVGRSAKPRELLDMHCSLLIYELGRRMVASGQQFRVTDLLKEMGCWSLYRHGREALPRVQRAIEKMKRKAR